MVNALTLICQEFCRTRTCGETREERQLEEPLSHTTLWKACCTRTNTLVRAIHLYTSAGQRVSNGFSHRVDVLPKLPNRVSPCNTKSEKFSLLDPRFSIKNSIGGFVSSERRGFSQTKHAFSTLFFFKLSASVILKSLKSGRISIGFGFFKDFFFSFFFSKMERVFNIGEILTNPLSKLILIDPLNWKKRNQAFSRNYSILQRRETRSAYTENFIPIETQSRCL